MHKRLFKVACVISISMLSLCSTKQDTLTSNLAIESQTIAVTVPLPCADLPKSDTLSKAIASIITSNYDTITSNLKIEMCTIKGTIQNIPSGDYSLELKVFNTRNELTYFGTAKFEILSGKATNVNIKLQKPTGSVNIIGTICDTVVGKEFTVDPYTLALYHFNEKSGQILYDETQKWNGTLIQGQRVPGYSGNALKLNFGNSATFDTIISTNTPNGTLELFFAFDSEPKSDSVFMLFGNDGSRCNFYYNNGTIVFMKNHHDIFKFVQAKLPVKVGTWYKIAGTWGNKGMRLFIDDVLVAQNTDTSCYQSSNRTTVENVFQLGVKTYIAMGGIGLYRPLSYEGLIDEIRISNIQRY